MSPVSWEAHAMDSEEDVDSDVDKYTSAKAMIEEKEIMRNHIVRLTEMLTAQKEHSQALQEELAELTVCCATVKEESLKAHSAAQANERLLREMNEKFTRVLQMEIPDILERLSGNSHALQTYNVKIKRLDEIVQDVHKKNERNFFSTLFWTVLSWMLSVLGFLVLGVTMVTNGLKSAALRVLPSPSTATSSPSSSFTLDPGADLSNFVEEQKQRIAKYMGDLKED